ncbi:MAG: pyridoxal-phosphate dependent enzyme [Candidatus Eisenbacteria bacterium]|uniref:Pyridoxal-phosphate dependent enzyme n=1 Tax=Eiseniibacteriota bacterium TaxID=2212470 RepID=A0A849SHK6_UNCEI|nr:pyridoxal-phosphate dependent enzyme [Candidatus Eisenbacteria bacterium]
MLVLLAEARERLAGVAHRTPVVTSRTLDASTGARVFLKCENLQRGGAFKFRGAHHTISRLDEATRSRGVIAFSSGNHAQAVALVAQRFGVPCTIVMPSWAPSVKLEATRGYGARVVFYDQVGEDRDGLAERLARERDLALIPPFDHPHVVTGQGTAAIELIEESGPLDLLVVPVGGGGLASGCVLAMLAHSPGGRVIGVEPDAGNDGVQSFRSGTRVRQVCGETIADGARTPSLGVRTFDLLRRHAQDLISVPDEALLEAMRFAFERLKLVIEPTGALALAAVRSGKIETRGRRVGIMLSGGNVDPALYANSLSPRA